MEQKENKKILKEKIKNWFKDSYNLTFFLILLFLVVYRLYWFFSTYNQPLWWDEANYMNMARTWLGSDYWNLQDDIVRPILFPFIISIILVLGLGETSVRFFVMLTSIISLPLVYGIGKLFFNKRIALISSFILAVFWSFSFYSYRILVDVPVTMLWLATIYFFFNAYFNDKSWKHFILPGIFLGLSFLMKYSSAVLVAVFAFYLITTEKLSVFKNRKIYVFFLISLITILPLFIYQYSLYGHPLQFNKAVAGTGNPYSRGTSLAGFADNFKSLIRQIPFIFNVIYLIFIIFFILGLLRVLFYLFSKELFIKKTGTNNYYFLVLWIVFNLIFFARLISSDTSYLDERYYHAFYPAIFLICSIGLESLYKIIRNYHKQLALILVIAFLLFGAYQNISHANAIIKLKKDSFLQLKLAGNYIKENTNKEDIIFILEEQAEITYYAQRKYMHIDTDNSTSIIEKLEKHKPKYVVMSFYYSLGNEFSYDIINYVFSHPELFTPVQAYLPYVDKEQKIPLAIIFKVNPLFYTL